MVVFFFFQAEDGIRDGRVTGVQTCALPIFAHYKCADHSGARSLTGAAEVDRRDSRVRLGADCRDRGSEERRVGEEWRSRGGRGRLKKKKGEGRGEAWVWGLWYAWALSSVAT